MTDAVAAARAAVFGLPDWAGRFVLVGAVVVVAIVLLSLIGWLVPRLMAHDGVSSADPVRHRQRQTAISALATTLRYVVLVAAVVAIAFALAGASGVATVGGGALVVVVLGFAFQRLLVDVIAGFFILFEDQYGVGDTVRVEPTGYTGVVTALGLRATELAGPGEERMVIPNGQITAVRLIPDGHRRHRLELLTDDPDAATAAVHVLGSGAERAGGPWRSAPRVVCQEGPPGLTRVIAILDVDAGREDAVAWLADALAAKLGPALAAPPLHGVSMAPG